MEDTPNGQFGQRVVSRAQVVFDIESAAAQIPNHKMVGRIVLYLVSIKKWNLVTHTSVQVRLPAANDSSVG